MCYIFSSDPETWRNECNTFFVWKIIYKISSKNSTTQQENTTQIENMHIEHKKALNVEISPQNALYIRFIIKYIQTSPVKRTKKKETDQQTIKYINIPPNYFNTLSQKIPDLIYKYLTA